MLETLLYIDIDENDPVHRRKLAGMRRYAVGRGWRVVGVDTRRSTPQVVLAMLERYRPAGCVVEASTHRDSFPPSLFGSVPVVYFVADVSQYPASPRFTTDDAAVARAAFSELSSGLPASYAAVGLRLVGWSRRRVAAFAGLCAAAGRPCKVFPGMEGESRTEYEERLASELPAWLSALPRHTAVFAANDAVARAVADAARAAGIGIPRRLTLLGVDDCAPPGHPSPEISSVRFDHERVGYLAAKMIGEGTLALPETTETPRTTGTTGSSRNSQLSQKSHSADVVICQPFTYGPLFTVRRNSTRGRGRHEPAIAEALEIIRREASEGLTAEALATRFPFSRRLFDLRFREAIGHSAYDEILSVRMEMAYALLARPEVPVGVIADMCGFASPIALHRYFSRRNGCSMTEWRRRYVGALPQSPPS